MLLPEPRASLDVREEEGDRACGKRRHVHDLALRAIAGTLSDRRSARPANSLAGRTDIGAAVATEYVRARPSPGPRIDLVTPGTPCCDKASRPGSPRPHSLASGRAHCEDF